MKTARKNGISKRENYERNMKMTRKANVKNMKNRINK